jgi:hypothetical protein
MDHEWVEVEGKIRQAPKATEDVGRCGACGRAIGEDETTYTRTMYLCAGCRTPPAQPTISPKPEPYVDGDGKEGSQPTDSQAGGRLLTQGEVDALPDGARVSVRWSGGNGPHEYTVERHHETVWAKECKSVIDYVGERPLTEVRLAQPPTGHLEQWKAIRSHCEAGNFGTAADVFAQAIADAVGEERERLLGFWEFVDKCESWLQNYPAEIFDGSSGDPGPLFAVAVRDAVAKIRSGDPARCS